MNGPRYILFLGTVCALLLAACGAVPPAAAPPTSAPASPPTATPRPGEVNNGQVLGLGPEFAFICRKCVNEHFPAAGLEYAAGLQELKNEAYPKGIIPWFHFQTQGFFGFGNGGTQQPADPANPQMVYGSSVVLSGAEDRSTFDALYITDFATKIGSSMPEGSPGASEIKDVAVGDMSAGATAEATVNGSSWRLNAVSFRQGDVGAFVFTLYPAAANAPADIVKVAQLYAESLK